MDYERIRTFVKSYIRKDSDKLEEIYSSAVKREVPVIREDTRDYLRLLLNQLKPERILEIGTAVGYSALFMAEVIDGICDCRIDTIELDDVRADEAEKHFSELDRTDMIHLYRGDAAEVLKEISGEYDMIFIDAAKAQYMNYLNLVMHMVLVEKRDRTIHDKLREYLFTLKNDERLETAILSIGDGVAVSVVKKI